MATTATAVVPKNQGNNHACKMIGDLIPRSIQLPTNVWASLDSLVDSAKAARADGTSQLKGRVGRASVIIGMYEVLALTLGGISVDPATARRIVIGVELTADDARRPRAID